GGCGSSPIITIGCACPSCRSVLAAHPAACPHPTMTKGSPLPKAYLPSTSIRRRNTDENGVGFPPHRIRAHVKRTGRGHGLAGLDLEPAAMQRALDHVTLDEAFAEQREGVGAHIVDGIELTVDIEDRDLALLELDAQPLAHRDIRDRGDAVKLVHRLLHRAIIRQLAGWRRPERQAASAPRSPGCGARAPCRYRVDTGTHDREHQARDSPK